MHLYNFRRVICLVFLFLTWSLSMGHAQSVSVPFPKGFIGTVGSNPQQADNILTFQTLGVVRGQFIQSSTNGQFSMQGNDIPGTLRLVLSNGSTIDLPGAIVWRHTPSGNLHAFGFIPNPANPVVTFVYGGGSFKTLDATSNYGLQLVASTVTYIDGDDINGNASTSGLLAALNSYLATITISGPQISGPSGVAGAAASAITVNENQTAVTTLTANRTVTWSIFDGTDAARFTINSTTGVLTFLAPPDFEVPTDSDVNNTYLVTVQALDADGYTGQQTVTVTVANLDDTAPLIQGPSGAAGDAASATSVAEGPLFVYKFTANEAVVWAIAGGEAWVIFDIDPLTGDLSFLSGPAFDPRLNAYNDYPVIVSATDTAGNASQQTVTVTVTAASEDTTPPVITGPSGEAGAAASAKSVPENQTAVDTFTASETVTWSISGGADLAHFAISSTTPTTGAVTFVTAPDFEVPTDADTNNIYALIVTATDTAGNASTQTLTITVTDLDETAPLIHGPSGWAGAAASAKSVPENQTTVHTFSVSVPETVTWTITGGADAAHFAINPTSGAVTFVTAPDFEVPTDAGPDNVYDLIVTATDLALNTSAQSVAITVTDDPEETTDHVITGPSGGAGADASAKSVPENQTAVHTFSASGEPVIWSIVDGADAEHFSIGAETGIKEFVVAPDFDVPTDEGTDNDYVVNILATDAKGGIARQTVTITVTNAIDTPTELVDTRWDEVARIISDVELNHLRAGIASRQAMARSARDRFIEVDRLRQDCRDIESSTVSAADNQDNPCDRLSFNTVPFDVDGGIEAGANGLSGAGMFYGQTGSVDGARRRIVSGEFQFVDDGKGIGTAEINGRVAWERLVTDRMMLGYFVEGGFARSSVDRGFLGNVNKSSLAFGAYVVAEPVDLLYLEGFASLGFGKNEFALDSDDLSLTGDYTSRSFLIGGAMSGVIERDGYEIRPELSLAYGRTNISRVNLVALTPDATAELLASVDGVNLATVSLAPEIIIPFDFQGIDSTFSFSPSISCEWADDDRSCGGGLALSLRGQTDNSLTTYELTLDADRISGVSRAGLTLNLLHQF